MAAQTNFIDIATIWLHAGKGGEDVYKRQPQDRAGCHGRPSGRLQQLCRCTGRCRRQREVRVQDRLSLIHISVATRINYDILTYLPQDLDSMIGEVALEDDFHLASLSLIHI